MRAVISLVSVGCKDPRGPLLAYSSGLLCTAAATPSLEWVKIIEPEQIQMNIRLCPVQVVVYLPATQVCP